MAIINLLLEKTNETIDFFVMFRDFPEQRGPRAHQG